jgi:hypothetical protein
MEITASAIWNRPERTKAGLRPMYTALDALPLWAVFVLVLLLVGLALLFGHGLGRRHRARQGAEKEGSFTAVVGTTLGLLAFLLAFTYNFAGSRVDARRSALLDEANAIRTTYLRADMLPEGHREEVRVLLAQYVYLRLEMANTKDMPSALRRTDELHDALWAHAVSIGRGNPDSEVFALFIDSLNETIDAHAKRALAVRTRVSPTVWVALFILAVIAFFTQGYETAFSGPRPTLAVMLMGVAFTIVITMVADLDRPHEGTLRVSQQPMIDLQLMMRAHTN